MTLPRPSARFLRLGFAVAVAAAIAAGPALAQDRKAGSAMLPKGYQGLGVSSNEPIQFEAESLEVRDQDQMAVFSGNVVVRQKDTVLKTDRLTVYYEGGQAAQAGQGQDAAGAAAAATGQQQIRRLEATGKVLVTSGPQTASGDSAVFDTKANTIVVSGNVVLTQGDNVIRGPKLLIDINTSKARMEGGRVQMLIEPKSLQQSKSTN